MLSVGSLFSGIGGFDLGLERSDFEIRWQVEIDPFCNKVLAKHWPNVKRYGDIRDVGKHNLEPVDILCGGPPCQPASVAGKRNGTGDDRWLWPETLRLVREIAPRWCLFENPTGILSLESGVPFENVCLELESYGYEVTPFIIPAAGVGAPHRRDRVWIVAYSTSHRSRPRRAECEGQFRSAASNESDSHAADTESRKALTTEQRGIYAELSGKNRGQWDEHWYEVATHLCRVDDGVSDRVHRLKSLGNAVVPQIVEVIGRAIMEVDDAMPQVQ